MNKRRKSRFYKALTKLLGQPHEMSPVERKRMFILLGGWMFQSKNSSVRKQELRTWGESPPVYRQTVYTPDPVSIVGKHVSKALTVPLPRWHWRIDRVVPWNKQMRGKLGIPNQPDFSTYAPSGAAWNFLQKNRGKDLTIMIPVNYHLTVGKHGIVYDNRKIVQRVWGHRVYSDKEVWSCSFWDFSGLTRDEGSWTKAKWTEGYVVKTAVNHAVHTSLAQAVQLATVRTVRTGIKSVLSEVNDEEA